LKWRGVSLQALLFLSYLAISIVQLRSLLPYLRFSSPGSASQLLLLHPVFGLVAPQLLERWYFDFYDVLYLFLAPFRPSTVTVDLAFYIFALAVAGFSFALYSKRLFTDLGVAGGLALAAASFLSGLIYMSNPFFVVEDLFWSTELEAYAVFPLALLSLHLALTSKDRTNQLGFLAAFSMLFSFALVEDSGHILSFGSAAILLQIFLTRSVRRISVPKSLLMAISGALWSSLIILPSFTYLFMAHYLGAFTYSYSGPVPPAFGFWTGSSSPIWMLANNPWFNRQLVFETLGAPRWLVAASADGGLALAALSALSYLAARARGHNSSFPLVLLSALAVLFGIYANFNGTMAIEWLSGVLPSNMLIHIFKEPYIYNYIVTLVYSLLPSYLLLVLLDRASSVRAAPRGGLRLKVLAVAVAALAASSAVLMAFPSYVYSASPRGGVGFVVQTGDLGVINSFEGLSRFLQGHPEGDVLWSPLPPALGASGNIAPRSYSFPLGSAGPLSTMLFNFLVGNYRYSLLGRGEYGQLAEISALMGVRYFIFYGPSLGIAEKLEGSGYFSPVYRGDNATVLENALYDGPVHASTRALLVSGGLATYSDFLKYQGLIYGNGGAPVPFLIDTYPFLNLSGDYDILTYNLTQLRYELDVVNSGYRYLYFPYSNITENPGWGGGNVADAGGYGWTRFALGGPDLWQGTYTVSDGIIADYGGPRTYHYVIPQLEGGEYHLMVRALEGPGSNFTLALGNQSFSVRVPATSVSGFTWVDLGYAQLPAGNLPVTIRTDGFLALQAIDVVPAGAWSAAARSSDAILKQHTIFLVLNGAPAGSVIREVDGLGYGGNCTILLANGTELALGNFTRIQPISGVLIINPSSGRPSNVSVSYRTGGSYWGYLIDSLNVSVEGAGNGGARWLYLIIPGYGPWGIADNSYISVKGQLIRPLPALGGAEGFAVPIGGPGGSGNATALTLDVLWYPEYEAYLNAVAYVALALAVAAILYPRFRFRARGHSGLPRRSAGPPPTS
jgi:hypothetical protein